MSRPFRRFQPQQPEHRVNGRIRARDVRVIGVDGQQVGVLELPAALSLARQYGVDLVEIAPNAQPPVCRLVDYGKFKYELAKKERDSKKTQHKNEVKEVQLSARIDPHDAGIKRQHAIDFLCEDLKLKVSLRFRGREMAHTEIGLQIMRRFLEELAPWGHPDNEPRLVGRAVNVMVTPLPKHKRAPNPNAEREEDEGDESAAEAPGPESAAGSKKSRGGAGGRVATDAAEAGGSLEQSPFSGLSLPAE